MQVEFFFYPKGNGMKYDCFFSFYAPFWAVKFEELLFAQADVFVLFQHQGHVFKGVDDGNMVEVWGVLG